MPGSTKTKKIWNWKTGQTLACIFVRKCWQLRADPAEVPSDSRLHAHKTTFTPPRVCVQQICTHYTHTHTHTHTHTQPLPSISHSSHTLTHVWVYSAGRSLSCLPAHSPAWSLGILIRRSGCRCAWIAILIRQDYKLLIRQDYNILLWQSGCRCTWIAILVPRIAQSAMEHKHGCGSSHKLCRSV